MKNTLTFTLFLTVILFFTCSKKVVPIIQGYYIPSKGGNSEIQLLPNGGFCQISTIYDVGGQDLSLGKYELINDTLIVELDVDSYFEINSAINQENCDSGFVTIKMIEIKISDDIAAFYHWYHRRSLIFGQKENGEVDTIHGGGLPLKYYFTKQEIRLPLDEVVPYKKIWLEYLGKEMGGKINLPEDYNCLYIKYPLIWNGGWNRVNRHSRPFSKTLIKHHYDNYYYFHHIGHENKSLFKRR